MKASYERINYALRPAKNVQRKMICDSLRGLAHIADVNSYRYIGFGSPYFSDFILFHKQLGIQDMISIERDEAKQRRFDFNIPFSCVKMKYGPSIAVLPGIEDWDKRTILWLDYDGPLSRDMLADVETFLAKAVSGSVIIVSVEVDPGKEAGNWKDALADLKRRLPDQSVPGGLKARDLAGWGLSGVVRGIVDDHIRAMLKQRNGGSGRKGELLYRQLFNFQYADGAKMLTVGGLLYDSGLAGARACRFDPSFTRDGSDAFTIQVPKLTNREIRYLDSLLPNAVARLSEHPDAQHIPVEDLDDYQEIYRFFPTFSEAEL